MSEEVPVEPAKDKEAPTKEIIEVEKSEDKKDIEDEEKEKMLNEENKKEIGEVEKKKKALEEAAEREGGRKRIPTGGIKIPGFLRSRSRDKNKDGEEKDEEADLLEPPCTATTVGSDDEKTDTPTTKKIKFPFMNPFAKKKKPEESAASSDPEAGEVPLDKRPGFLHAIKLPLVNVLPRKLRSTKEPDVEEGGGSTPSKPAGLASMETLDDSNGSTKHSDEKGDEGLETVKLDSSEEKAALESDKNTQEKKPWDREVIMARIAPLKEFKYIIGGVCLFLLLLIIIIVIAVSGPRPLTSSPVIDGRYVRAVTSCGYVEGVLEDGAVVFRGIPYARPPLGERRWRKPEPFILETCWNGTLKTHNASDTCWQIYSNGTINGREDCLTLDIVTPQVQYMNPLPVRPVDEIVSGASDDEVGEDRGQFNPLDPITHKCGTATCLVVSRGRGVLVQ